jgi:3-hydroxybutyryl-CoA dehydrogenase
MTVKKVFIVGAGLMGSGIAQSCAQAGIEVCMHDVKSDALERALQNIEWSVRKFIEKGNLKENTKAVMNRIEAVSEFSGAASADLIIEAVFESVDVKNDVFQRLDKVVMEEAIMASNTSAIPITEIASAVSRPERVLGLHFFSPVPMMKAVEVIKGVATNDETAQKGKDFVLQIGKEAIMVNRDVGGFVINRINLPSTIEAMKLVEQGVATVEDIDKGLRLASGRKMGIFETGDMIGLDVTYGALMAMFKESGDPRWYPPLSLRRKVKAGHLGRKTGRGWYDYNKDGSRKEP